jgi:predicted small lipoprotein YifL
MRRVVLVLLAVAMTVPLAACGRRGAPIAPENSVYPRKYPNTPFESGPTASPTVVEDDFMPPAQRRPVTPNMPDLQHPPADTSIPGGRP